jgi:cytosine/adenosine deaminase-related metal-dependent hydrolase
MPVLLKNATYVDWKTLEFSHGNILAEPDNNAIRFIENPEMLVNVKDLEILDCQGKLVTKSFAVGHHHSYSALSRGMPGPKKKPENFQQILKLVWWTGND